MRKFLLLLLVLFFGTAVGATTSPSKKNDLWNKLQQAETLKNKGDFAQAHDLLQGVLAESPKFAQAHFALGVLYMKQKDWQKAADALVEALRHDDELAEAYFSLAYIREKEGRLRDAGFLYSQARAYDQQGNAEIRFNLANILTKLNRIPQAVAMYKEAIVMNPKHVDAIVNLSLLYYKFKDYDKAAELLKVAMKYGHQPDPQYRAALAHLF